MNYHELRESQRTDSEEYEDLPLFVIQEKFGKTEAGRPLGLVLIQLIYSSFSVFLRAVH